MEKMKVSALMRSVSEFPKISNQATFARAVEILDKAQEDFTSGKAPQRILLVYDEDTKKIVGKLSPMDLVYGLEPNYDKIESLKDLSYYRIANSVFENMKEQFRLWQQPLDKLCTKAVEVKIQNCIRTPSPDHILSPGDSMDKAFHLFVVGRNDSLFVMEGKDIVGLIRFSDVYRKIVETIRACPLPA
jgi:hypothetical protein